MTATPLAPARRLNGLTLAEVVGAWADPDRPVTLMECGGGLLIAAGWPNLPAVIESARHWLAEAYGHLLGTEITPDQVVRRWGGFVDHDDDHMRLHVEDAARDGLVPITEVWV